MWSQPFLKAWDSPKHLLGNTVTLQCISYHYHARVQQREVQVMDIWITGIILRHLCMGQTRLTCTLHLKQIPLSWCVTIPHSTWAARSTANDASQLLTQIPPCPHIHLQRYSEQLISECSSASPNLCRHLADREMDLLSNLWQIYTGGQQQISLTDRPQLQMLLLISMIQLTPLVRRWHTGVKNMQCTLLVVLFVFDICPSFSSSDRTAPLCHKWACWFIS